MSGRWETYLLDCDGVLFDSNELKSRAFRDVVAARFASDAAERFVAYHRAHGGISRYVKFRHLIDSILEQPFDQGLYDTLLAAYGERCRELYAAAPLAAGAAEFLAARAGKALYVVTGGDQEEIRAVLASRGLAGHFRAVYGAPRPKPELARAALADSGCPPVRAVLVGDSLADLEAARAAGTDFVFARRHAENAAAVLARCAAEGDLVVSGLDQMLEEGL